MSFIRKDFTYKILSGLLFGIFFSEIISYLIYFDLIPHCFYLNNNKIYCATPDNPTPFLNHVSYGIILSFVISVLFYKILTTTNYKAKEFLFISFFFTTISINLFLQASHAGYILFFTSILFILMYIYRYKIIKFFIPIFLLFGLWYYSTKVIQDNFWFGVGTGDVMDELKTYTKNTDLSIRSLKDPHNEFLDFFMKFGILGFVLIIYLFFKLLTIKNDGKLLDFILKVTALIMFISMLQGVYLKGWMFIF